MTTDDYRGPAVVFGGGRRPRPGVDSGLRNRVRIALAEAGEVLRTDLATTLPSDDPGTDCSAGRLTQVARFLVDRGHLTSSVDEDEGRVFYLLALDLQQLALELQQNELAMRTRRLESCGDGLGRLRGVPTSSDLVRSVCREVVDRCDFGRVVFSRVEGGSWMPSMAHFGEDDATWFAEWVDAGIALRGNTPETRILTERRPAVVYDTSSTDVHRQIIVESGHSASYVVAPLLSGGSVVGFLHADHFPSSRQVEQVDRDVLWAFAEGFARIHERAILMERVTAQRSRVEEALGSALQGIGKQVDVDVSGAGARFTAGSAALADLTAREVEVVHLMVEGATNRAIGARLVIAEDTVKSHVKQILRKLGVANRAQAIATVAGTALA